MIRGVGDMELRLLWNKAAESRKGLGTVEIVIITAILVGLALLFREQILQFLRTILGRTFEHADSIFD